MFHLRPHRRLPDNFRAQYHGVRVDLPNRLYDPERGHTLYNEYLDMLEYADQMGFDATVANSPGRPASSLGSTNKLVSFSCYLERRRYEV